MQKAFLLLKRYFQTLLAPFYFGNPSTIIFSLLGILILFSAEWRKWNTAEEAFHFLNNKNWIVRKLSYAVLIIIILLIRGL